MDWVGIGLGDLGLKGCTEFVYPECWHFDSGASSKIDDVLAEDGGLLHVLPLFEHYLMTTWGQTRHVSLHIFHLIYVNNSF